MIPSSDDPAVLDAAIVRIMAAVDSAENVSYRSAPDGRELMAVCSMRTLSWTWVPSSAAPIRAGDLA